MNSKWISMTAVVFSFLLVFAISVPQQAFAIAITTPAVTATKPAMGTVGAVTGIAVVYNPATRQYSTLLKGSKVPAGAVVFLTSGSSLTLNTSSGKKDMTGIYGGAAFNPSTGEIAYSNTTPNYNISVLAGFFQFVGNGTQLFSPPGTKKGSGSNSETEIIDTTLKDTELNVNSGI